MKIKKPKRIMSLFLAALMCVTSLVGIGTTAYRRIICLNQNDKSEFVHLLNSTQTANRVVQFVLI